MSLPANIQDFHSMRSNGSPLPEFEFDENHSYFLLRLPVHPAAKKVEQSVEIESFTGVESGVESSMGRHILLMLIEEALGKKQIARLLGKDKPTRYVNDLVRKLMDARLIEYTNPDKPNSRLQKYRLTETGRASLSQSGQIMKES